MGKPINCKPHTCETNGDIQEYADRQSDKLLYSIDNQLFITITMFPLFFKQHPTLPCFLLVVDDVKLNSTMFHWPEHISTVFEVSHKRLSNKRDHSEDDLRKKLLAFEEKLADFQQLIEIFRKKEVSTCSK